MMYLFLGISIIPYGTLAAFGPELFSFVFGEEWVMSGKIAQYFSVYCILELLYFSLDSVYYVLREEKKLFVFQASTFVLRFAVLFGGIHFNLSLEYCLLLLSGANVILYSTQLSYILHLLKLKWWKHLFLLFVSIAAAVTLFFGLKSILKAIGLFGI